MYAWWAKNRIAFAMPKPPIDPTGFLEPPMQSSTFSTCVTIHANAVIINVEFNPASGIDGQPEVDGGGMRVISVLNEFADHGPAPVGVFRFRLLKVAVRHLHLPSSAHDGRPTDCWHPLAGATFLGATTPEASHASNFVTSITILRCPAGRTMQSIMPLDRKPAFGNFA